jgi:hypothetical protein
MTCVCESVCVFLRAACVCEREREKDGGEKFAEALTLLFSKHYLLFSKH